jgi:hypothetical protein
MEQVLDLTRGRAALTSFAGPFPHKPPDTGINH